MIIRPIVLSESILKCGPLEVLNRHEEEVLKVNAKEVYKWLIQSIF